MTVRAYLNPGIKSLNLSISSPTDTYSGRFRNDLNTVKVWCYLTSGEDLTTQSPPIGNLVYDGLSLQVHIPNLVPNSRYYVKYALVSNIDPSPLGYTVSDELSQFVYENPTDGEYLLAGDGAGGFQNVTLDTGLILDNNTLKTTGLAKTTESFVVMSSSGQLTNERVLTQGTGIIIRDNGPNNTVVISLGGVGALTSVGLGTPNNFFLSVSGSPLTADGNIGLSYSPGNALPVTSGGTGRANLGTGLLKGNSTGAIITGTAGVDYVGPTSGADLLMGNANGGIKNVSIGDNIVFANGVIRADLTAANNILYDLIIANPVLTAPPSISVPNTSNNASSNTASNIPRYTTPNIGVPSFAILTNATGLPLNTGTTGILNIANGGTNANTRDNARRNIMPLALGAGMAGWVLTLDNTGTDSYWEAPIDAKNVITTINTSAPLTAQKNLVSGGTSSQVNIALTGIVNVANGGTGANTASNARINLLPNYVTKGTKFLRVNAGETDVDWVDVPMPNLIGGYVTGTGNLGRSNAEANGTAQPSNILSLRSNYNNNNYPTAFGNMLTLGGEGDGQIYLAWPSTGGTGANVAVSADGYIRSRRDVSNSWSPWAKLITSVNYNTAGYFSNVAISGSYTDLLGKPLLANVAITGSYADLADKPNIPTAQVNSDWNATTGLAVILNKPNVPTKLSNLTDANTAGATTGQILIYNAAANVWRPGNVSTISGTANVAFAEQANTVLQTVQITQGGTGQTTRQAAINALAGNTSIGRYLRGDGANIVMSNIAASDLNGLTITANIIGNATTANTANTAGSISGIVAIANGGTGQSDRQKAINELTNNILTAGTVLQINAQGNAVMSAITSAMLTGLTLSANVTGSAGSVTSTVGIGLGGTGQVTRQNAINGLFNNVVTSGTYARGDGTNITMSGIQAADVPLLNQSTTGSAGSLVSTYIVPATQGGTGQGGTSAYTIGDMLYASSNIALSKLAAAAAGNVLLTQGANTSPIWGKVNLATMTTGQLPATQGGTGTSSGSTGTGNVVLSSNATLVSPALGTPTSITLTNATGLPLGGTGVTGILNIANGGTGKSSWGTGIVKYSGTAFATAVAGTDFAGPTSGSNIIAGNGAGGFTAVALGGPLSYTGGVLSSTALDPSFSYTWTALQTFNKSLFVAPTEIIAINTTSPNGTNCTLNAIIAPIMWTTANPTANWTLNITGVSTLLATNNRSLSIVHLVSNGTPAYYQAALSIDSVAQSASSIKWLGGIVPSSGGASSVDVYTFTILKDSGGVYTIIASVARYA